MSQNPLVQGYGATAALGAIADKGMALGYGASVRIPGTINLSGMPICRKDNGESSADCAQYFSANEFIIQSKEVDLEAVAEQTITLPAGCKFFVNEAGVIATVVSGLTVQPTVRFGRTGSLALLLAATITTGLTAAGGRHRFTTLLDASGLTSLTAGVTIAAVATTLLGRFYWLGMLVEDE